MTRQVGFYEKNSLESRIGSRLTLVHVVDHCAGQPLQLPVIVFNYVSVTAMSTIIVDGENRETRSQAVARIADRMPHGNFGGHVTSSVT